MNHQPRRSFLATLSAATLANSISAEATNMPYLFAKEEGEHLIHFRDHGNIFIKASAATGSEHLAIGTQQVKRGTGIPVHRHPEMQETFYVLEGQGSVLLNDVPHPFTAGATVFIPPRTWHGFLNPDSELLVLWMVTPSGLEAFFRETCSPPGVPDKNLTRDEIRAIALRHGTEFR